MKIDAGHALVGQKYKVKAEDCCVSVSFEATLIERTYEPAPDELMSELVFDNGVRIHGIVVQLEPIIQ